MPPIKAIETAQFGGVDSRSNPVTMPQNRWLVCKNWIPRPDGHLELREGYMIRVYNQIFQGGAAYSPIEYTTAAPYSYVSPPAPQPPYSPITGMPPPILPPLPNGTRCLLYWQQTAPAQAIANVSSVGSTISGPGVPILARYAVDSNARFLLGHYVTVANVVSAAGTPANFFNGHFQIQALGNKSITLLLGTSGRSAPPGPGSRFLPLPPPVRPPLPPPSAAFTVSPTSINFGNVSPNAVANISVTLTFTTTASTGVGTVNSITLSNAEFYLTNVPALPHGGMSNQQTLTFQVNINQSLIGGYSATLTIGTSTQTFNLTVSANVQGSDITVIPPALNFGNQTVGAVASALALQITNNTTHGVTLSSPAFSNPDFSLVNSPPSFPYGLGPGSYLNLAVDVTPSISGTDSGTLTINTDDTNFPQISVSLEAVGVVPGSGGAGYPENYAGTGGTITAVDMSPGVPVPLLVPLTTAAGQALSPASFPMKGNPILSTAPWHYALGKDGYLYMHNGIDAKFFDGVCFRDIGLPPLTVGQQSAISVSIGFSGPPDSAITNASITWASPGGFQATPYTFLYSFFDTSNNSLAGSATPLTGNPVSPPQNNYSVTISNLPTSTSSTVVGLLGLNGGGGAGASFVTVQAASGGTAQGFEGTMSGSDSYVTVTTSPAHGMSGTGNVVAIDDYPVNIPAGLPSSGPFAVNITGPNTFTFQLPAGVNASLYTGTVFFSQLLTVPNVTTTVTLVDPSTLQHQGVTPSPTPGQPLMPYIESLAAGLLPASTIGGAQPGYQFYASIYDPITGHVGNRVPIGLRVVNSGNANITISGLPNFTVSSPSPAPVPTTLQWGRDNGIKTISLPSTDPEWRILIGRTGDGGEVPYACIDSNGNWVQTTSPSQSTLNATAGQTDPNSELPFNNYPPPAFNTFWREGDRLCGTVKDQPFVYRSGSELDATTGIFVGDPAQAWDPSRSETFPTSETLVSGFGYMGESWVFTRNDAAQISELSGEVAWNGPYGFGIVGPWAFAKGWQSLPYWISHDRQLCTMLPYGDGPISISTEYEKTLLARIGDEYDALGNPLMYMQKTEMIYFRDPIRLIDSLRIRCVDNNGQPFTVIHDFNLRDDASPYGQGYEEDYLGPLSNFYQSTFIRDSSARARVWAAASDGAIYQFYTGGLDNMDYYDGTQGDAFTADAITLRYIGGERTAARTLEWYGDQAINWSLFENMLNVIPDALYWVNITFNMMPFPGDAQSAHYIADIQRPEMIHCYLWAQLTAHPADVSNPSDPMALNDPPHIPLETYGRLYLAAPWLAGSRGR